MGISAVTPTVVFVSLLILEHTSHTLAFASLQPILEYIVQLVAES